MKKPFSFLEITESNVFFATVGQISPPAFHVLIAASLVHGVEYPSPAIITGSAFSNTPSLKGRIFAESVETAIRYAELIFLLSVIKNGKLKITLPLLFYIRIYFSTLNIS